MSFWKQAYKIRSWYRMMRHYVGTMSTSRDTSVVYKYKAVLNVFPTWLFGMHNAIETSTLFISLHVSFTSQSVKHIFLCDILIVVWIIWANVCFSFKIFFWRPHTCQARPSNYNLRSFADSHYFVCFRYIPVVSCYRSYCKQYLQSI